MSKRDGLIRTLLLLLVLLLAGCETLSNINPFADEEDEELEPAELIEFDPEARLDDAWDASVGGGMGERFNRLVPAVRDGVVYAADAYGLLEAREMRTGERLWQTRVGSPAGSFLSGVVFWGRDDDGGAFVTGGVGVDDSAVFVGTRDGELFAIRRSDGAQLWKAQLSSEILAPAASDGERVFVATLDGRLTALSRSAGARLWSYDTQVPVLTLRGTGAPVLADSLVLIGFANGRLTALRAEDGSTMWENVVSLPAGRSELERMADVDAAPLILQSSAIVGSYQGALKALRLADGSVQWERPVSTFSGLAEGYGLIFVTDDEGVIHAYNRVTGSEEWTQDVLIRRGVTGPAAFGSYIAVADFEGYVHIFAQADGRPIARTRADSDGVRSTPIGIGNQLLVFGNGGQLAVYDIQRL